MPTSDRNTIDTAVSVFIVDDHPIVIEGIQTVIEKQSNYEVCGFGSTIKEALKEIKANKPTVLISDISLNKESGIDLIKEVRKKLPDTKILTMSMHDEVYYIETALKNGANGYILKSETSEYLIAAIETILGNKRYLSYDLEQKLLNSVLEEEPSANIASYIDKLTKKEKEIFDFIGKGKSSKDIAKQLGISIRTVESHKDNIKKKLNKNSMNEVLESAIEWIRLQ